MTSVFQYSAGVVAQPGYEIIRVRFARPIAMREGFSRIEKMMNLAARPLTAFCACELRSPHPVSDNDFLEFNKRYVEQLRTWGLFDGALNPVARSNVCPEIDPPKEPSIYAFAYTKEAKTSQASFIVSGGAEVPEGHANYRDHIVRLGDTSKEAMSEKSSFVIREMERRLSALGFAWADTTDVHVYTIHDLDRAVVEEISRRGASCAGLNWHYCRPPIAGLEYEMDCRRVLAEYIEK